MLITAQEGLSQDRERYLQAWQLLAWRYHRRVCNPQQAQHPHMEARNILGSGKAHGYLQMI